MSEFVYRYLWHEVRVDAADIVWPAGLPVSGRDHNFAPEVDLTFSVVRTSATGHDVFEGADLLATALSSDDAGRAITARVERRALELLVLKGWSRFRGSLYSKGSERDERCALVVAGTQESPVSPGLVALQDGWAMNLPLAGFPLVSGVVAECDFRLRPIGALGIAELAPVSRPPERMGELAAVEVLMGSAEPLVESPRLTVLTAVEVVRRVPAYRLWFDSAENLRAKAESLVNDPPEG